MSDLQKLESALTFLSVRIGEGEQHANERHRQMQAALGQIHDLLSRQLQEIRTAQLRMEMVNERMSIQIDHLARLVSTSAAEPHSWPQTLMTRLGELDDHSEVRSAEQLERLEKIGDRLGIDSSISSRKTET